MAAASDMIDSMLEALYEQLTTPEGSSQYDIAKQNFERIYGAGLFDTETGVKKSARLATASAPFSHLKDNFELYGNAAKYQEKSKERAIAFILLFSNPDTFGQINDMTGGGRRGRSQRGGFLSLDRVRALASSIGGIVKAMASDAVAAGRAVADSATVAKMRAALTKENAVALFGVSLFALQVAAVYGFIAPINISSGLIAASDTLNYVTPSAWNILTTSAFTVDIRALYALFGAVSKIALAGLAAGTVSMMSKVGWAAAKRSADGAAAGVRALVELKRKFDTLVNNWTEGKYDPATINAAKSAQKSLYEAIATSAGGLRNSINNYLTARSNAEKAVAKAAEADAAGAADASGAAAQAAEEVKEAAYAAEAVAAVAQAEVARAARAARAAAARGVMSAPAAEAAAAPAAAGKRRVDDATQGSTAAPTEGRKVARPAAPEKSAQEENAREKEGAYEEEEEEELDELKALDEQVLAAVESVANANALPAPDDATVNAVANAINAVEETEAKIARDMGVAARNSASADAAGAAAAVGGARFRKTRKHKRNTSRNRKLRVRKSRRNRR